MPLLFPPTDPIHSRLLSPYSGRHSSGVAGAKRGAGMAASLSLSLMGNCCCSCAGSAAKFWHYWWGGERWGVWVSRALVGGCGSGGGVQRGRPFQPCEIVLSAVGRIFIALPPPPQPSTPSFLLYTPSIPHSFSFSLCSTRTHTHTHTSVCLKQESRRPS